MVLFSRTDTTSRSIDFRVSYAVATRLRHAAMILGPVLIVPHLSLSGADMAYGAPRSARCLRGEEQAWCPCLEEP